jgi:hypothetical protein
MKQHCLFFQEFFLNQKRLLLTPHRELKQFNVQLDLILEEIFIIQIEKMFRSAGKLKSLIKINLVITND